MKKLLLCQDAKPLFSLQKSAEFERASDILADYLAKMTGGRFEINERGKITFAQKDLGRDGIAYRIESEGLVFEATDAQAMVFAVYDFLEKIGCGFYAPDCYEVPHSPTLEISFDDVCFTPPNFYRETYSREFLNQTFAEMRKTRYFIIKPDQWAHFGPEVHPSWGYWCHSFGKLVRPSIYFDEHPEYFGMVDGVRSPKAQICLSNPDVLEVLCQNLAEEITYRPEAPYWSVSQDDHGVYCQCDNCNAINEEEGSQAGTIIRFVNRVAERFPDRLISTLAYWYSCDLPKYARPIDNVHIMLCTNYSREKPLTQNEDAAFVRKQIKEWTSVTPNVMVWDYPVQYLHLYAPFPNFRTMGDSLRFFADCGVHQIFNQTNHYRGGEFHALRAYLWAEMTWNPYQDEAKLIEKFVKGYYGAAAPYVLEYIDTLHDALESTGGQISSGPNGTPTAEKDTFLTEEWCRRYLAIWQKAEDAVKGDTTLSLRVMQGAVSVWYVMLYLDYCKEDEWLPMLTRVAKVFRSEHADILGHMYGLPDQFVADQVLWRSGGVKVDDYHSWLPADYYI